MAKKANKGAANTNGSPSPQGSPYFLSLSIENARCFSEKQTLKLSDEAGRPARWTILLGNNGTGKTTLLQSLAAIAASLREKPQRKGAEQFSLQGEWLRLPEMLRSHLRHSGNVTLEAELALRQQGIGSLVTPTALTRSSLEVERNGAFQGIVVTGTHPSIDEESYPFCFAYSAGRRLTLPSFGESNIDDPVANLFNDSIPLRNAEEWLLQLDYSATKESPIQQRQKRRLDHVRRLLLHILPEVTDLRFSVPSEQQPTPRVEFLTPYGWVHLRALGYGYQTLIAWMVDLASRLVERYPDSADPLAEPAVVLVDEIDLHLHPVWQRTLISHLTERFPHTQFIVTAHSPLVVQSAGEANLAVLRREGDHVVIDNDVQSVHGWRVDQIYTSELFGLPSARSPEVEALFDRRRAILEKPKLTEKDKRELAELEVTIGQLPAGESAQHIETMRVIQESLAALKQYAEVKR